MLSGPAMRDTKKKGGRALTPKQQRFAKVYAATGNASEAYRQTYSPKNSAADTIHRNAYELSQKPHVKAAIEAEKAIINAKLDAEIVIDRNKIASMLIDASKLAHEGQQAGAAVQAAVALGKLFGHYVERSENLNRNEQELSDAQLEAIAKRVEEDQLNQAVSSASVGDAKGKSVN